MKKYQDPHVIGGEPRRLGAITRSKPVLGGGKVVRNQTLLGWVWGKDYMEETHLLKVHIKHIRDKLGEQTDAPICQNDSLTKHQNSHFHLGGCSLLANRGSPNRRYDKEGGWMPPAD